MSEIDNKLKNMSVDEICDYIIGLYKGYVDKEEIKDLPQMIKDILYIIDYDTEISMEGLIGYFNDSTVENINELITALNNCGAINEVEILKQAMILDTDDFKSFQKLEEKVYLYSDTEGFWERVYSYINMSR